MKPHTLFSIALALPLTVAGLAASSDPAQAQSARLETLVVANEFGPNMLDIHGLGANRPAYGVSWNAYDRLLTYGRKTLPDGVTSYDFTKLEPELAERWEVADDGMSVTFHLRRDATFHDGTPVKAADVKWSFERALGMSGLGRKPCSRERGGLRSQAPLRRATADRGGALHRLPGGSVQRSGLASVLRDEDGHALTP